jgi:glutathione S-transferase
MTIIFYDCKTAPSPRRTRILLAEKNVPHKTVEINLMTNEQMGDDFRKINPDCTVPALQLEDGKILKDNASIATYLEEVYPTPPLLGITPYEKAVIASWQSKIDHEFGMAIASALRNANPAMKDRALPGKYNYKQIPDLSIRGLKQIDNFFITLENHLLEKEFIATEKFSIADISAACALDFARVVKKKAVKEIHPNIIRWRSNLSKRKSFNI